MRLATTALLVGLCCGGLGLYLGHRGASADLRAARAAASAAQSAAERPSAAPSLCIASLDRQVLREELARTLGGGAAAETPAAAPPAVNKEPPPPSPQQAAAFDSARHSVDQALARGTLSSEQMEDLHTLLLNVDPDSHYRLVTDLVVAMNHEKLKIEGRPLF